MGVSDEFLTLEVQRDGESIVGVYVPGKPNYNFYRDNSWVNEEDRAELQKALQPWMKKIGQLLACRKGK